MDKVLAILNAQEAQYDLWSTQNTIHKEDYIDAVKQIKIATEILTNYNKNNMKNTPLTNETIVNLQRHLFNEIERLKYDIQRLAGFVQNDLSKEEFSNEEINSFIEEIDSTYDDVVYAIGDFRDRTKTFYKFYKK